MASVTRMEFQELGTKPYPNKIAKFSKKMMVEDIKPRVYWLFSTGPQTTVPFPIATCC